MYPRREPYHSPGLVHKVGGAVVAQQGDEAVEHRPLLLLVVRGRAEKARENMHGMDGTQK